MKYLKTMTELLESKYPNLDPTTPENKSQDFNLIDIIKKITISTKHAFEYLNEMKNFLSYVDAGKVDIWVQKNKSRYPEISSTPENKSQDSDIIDIVKKLNIFAKAEVLLDFEYLDQMEILLRYVDVGKFDIWFKEMRSGLSHWLEILSTQDFLLDDSDLSYMGLGPSGSNNASDGRPKFHTKSGYDTEDKKKDITDTKYENPFTYLKRHIDGGSF